MAYTATVTSTVERRAGKRVWTYKIVETEASSTSEYTLTGVPRQGLIRLHNCRLVSGAGSTVQPRFGKATGWSDDTYDDIDGVASPSAYHREGVPLPYSFDPDAASPTIYGRSTANSATANHVIHTLLTIEEL